ncbi:MAG: hypothetical protein ACREHD_16540, partial [Pirellulales bacterium]
RGIENETRTPSPMVNAEIYAACIADAMRAQALALPEKTRWLINDYCETLDFLALSDRVIVECGEWLRENGITDDLLGEWLMENRPWVEQRIARQVVGRFKMPGWSAEATAEKDGSIIDLAFDHGLRVCSGSDSASLYLQWKIGKGFALHAIAGDYPNSPPGSVRLMNWLFDRAKVRLREHWKGRKDAVFSGRPGKKSVMVGRAVATTWSCEEILDKLQIELPALEGLAKEVVAELKAEFGGGQAPSVS